MTSDMQSLARIELVFDRDCPNVERARENIAVALREMGAPESWTEWDRESPQTPAALRHYGSPSVLVNGEDVGCDEAASPEADANSCRVYFDASGKCVCGAPSPRLILEAILAVIDL